LRDSHKLLVTPYRELEQQFGGKIVLVKDHILSLKFVLICFFYIALGDFYFSAPVSLGSWRA
jgi:hypothetical protein